MNKIYKNIISHGLPTMQGAESAEEVKTITSAGRVSSGGNMVKSYGHEYTVVLNYKMAVRVTAHEAEDAIDKAFKVIEDALDKCEEGSVEVQRAWSDIARRGEEVLEPMEDE